jgi:thiamine biosynthesis lipoprotein
MGSPCALHLYAESAAQLDAAAAAAADEVTRLERKYSRYRADSLATAINASAGDPAGIELDAETAALLDYADTSFRESGGLFDVTSGVLRRVWDFRSARLPTQAQVDAVLALVGWGRVRWERPRLVLPDAGMEIDFGGYVKEYAADRAADACRSAGLRHGMVDLGGDLHAIGPHPDGRPWNVGIRHPRRPHAALATVPLVAGGLATSGDYERCMIVNGVRYGHILDPRTGWPARGLASVSVLAPRCLIAGTAATVAMLKGVPEGLRWLDALGLPSLRADESGAVRPRGRPRGLRLRSPAARCAPASRACGPSNGASNGRCGTGARRDRAG